MVKFFNRAFSALFEILDANIKDTNILVFDALVFLVNIITDSKVVLCQINFYYLIFLVLLLFWSLFSINHKPVSPPSPQDPAYKATLNEFIDHFDFVLAWRSLLSCIHFYLQKYDNAQVGSNLILIKVFYNFWTIWRFSVFKISYIAYCVYWPLLSQLTTHNTACLTCPFHYQDFLNPLPLHLQVLDQVHGEERGGWGFTSVQCFSQKSFNPHQFCIILAIPYPLTIPSPRQADTPLGELEAELIPVLDDLNMLMSLTQVGGGGESTGTSDSKIVILIISSINKKCVFLANTLGSFSTQIEEKQI